MSSIKQQAQDFVRKRIFEEEYQGSSFVKFIFAIGVVKVITQETTDGFCRVYTKMRKWHPVSLLMFITVVILEAIAKVWEVFSDFYNDTEEYEGEFKIQQDETVKST